jgi:phage terminase large subunit
MTTPSPTTTANSDGGLYGVLIPAFMPLYHEADSKDVRHFFLWGGRGGAKTTALADFFTLHGRSEKSTYLCTRETQNSMAESVYGSIVQSIKTLAIPGYYMTEASIDHVFGAHMVFAGIGYKNGQHVKSMTNIGRAWTEEAQQVSTHSLQVLVPTVRRRNSKLYYSFNRVAPRDPIFDYFLSFKTRKQKLRATMEDGTVVSWYLHRGDGAIGIEINYDGNPYFPSTLEADRQRDLRFAELRGDYAQYNHVWLGMPQAAGESSIITIRQAMEASRRKVEDDGAEEIGADIARGGKDRVVFYKRKGLRVTELREYRQNSDGEKRRITETAERLMAFAGDDKRMRIKVDDTGLGGGVTDILEDRGYNVVGVNFAQNAADRDHYANVVAEMWFGFASIIDTVQIPDDIELIEELTERREGRRDSKGRRTVEKKDEFIGRVGRSPDKADALLLCFYEPNHVIDNVPWVIA